MTIWLNGDVKNVTENGVAIAPQSDSEEIGIEAPRMVVLYVGDRKLFDGESQVSFITASHGQVMRVKVTVPRVASRISDVMDNVADAVLKTQIADSQRLDSWISELRNSKVSSTEGEERSAIFAVDRDVVMYVGVRRVNAKDEWYATIGFYNRSHFLGE